MFAWIASSTHPNGLVQNQDSPRAVDLHCRSTALGRQDGRGAQAEGLGAESASTASRACSSAPPSAPLARWRQTVSARSV